MTQARLIFIHRSVGENLIDDAGLYRLVHDTGAPYTLSDYNQNTDVLRTENGSQHMGWKFPGGDTTPADYATLFSEEGVEARDPILQAILGYDIVAIKSCFPNTRTTSDKMLAEHQQAYQQIAQFFSARPDKKLAILTSPPLIPLLTLPPFARRARALATWLNTTNLGPNTFVFDLFNELAIPEGGHQANTLRKNYRRRFPLDSHPNTAAGQTIAPQLVAFWSEVAQTR